jgi:hypothetical protein
MAFFSFRDARSVNMADRKVLALEIIYRTMYKQIFSYLIKITKTRLKSVGAQKMAVKNGLFDLKCYNKQLV